MPINRTTIRRLERAARAETVLLSCPECGQEMRVGQDTDLELIAYDWVQSTGEKSHRPTPRDVLTLLEHPHDVENLIDTRTGEKWLERLLTAPASTAPGGHDGD